MAELSFRLEDRGGVQCVVYHGGGVRPASLPEIALWSALHSKPPDQEGRRLTQDDGRRLLRIVGSINEKIGHPDADADVRYLRQLARSALQDSPSDTEGGQG